MIHVYFNALCVHACDKLLVANKSVYIHDSQNGISGSGAVLRIANHNSSRHSFLLSCQHTFACFTYNSFGDRQHYVYSTFLGAFNEPLYGFHFNLHLNSYKRQLVASDKFNAFTVNETRMNETVDLFTYKDGSYKILGECCPNYLSFCELGIDIPIDVSVLKVENLNATLANVCELPTNEQISSWKDKALKVIAHGYHSTTQAYEYTITCDMQLNNDGNWFKSVEPIPSDFIDLHGMSGGPCFVDDVLCGVISGCDNEKRLCVRALTTDLVEAIKFGVERFMDK